VAGHPVSPAGAERPATQSDPWQSSTAAAVALTSSPGHRSTRLSRLLLPCRLPLRLIEPVLEYVVGMTGGPAVREQRLQVRLARAQSQHHVPKVGPRLRAMTLASRQTCHSGQCHSGQNCLLPPTRRNSTLRGKRVGAESRNRSDPFSRSGYRQAKETKCGETDVRESQCLRVVPKRANGPSPDPVERRGHRVVDRRPEPRRGHRTSERVTPRLMGRARDSEPAT
jgi:hypothetical protein